jgi:hypothetical protein
MAIVPVTVTLTAMRKVRGGGLPPGVASRVPPNGSNGPITDISAYPVLTEEVGYPPSPLARPSGGPSVGVPGASPLGQIAAKAVADVLGWKPKTGDAKGFVGALTQAFTLTEVEGHIESKWTPRTYAIQTDLSGGITGAQASIYTRGKEALDQSLPLLDGLYKLNPEANDEDVAALKAVTKSQLTELVNELGFLGGPRITRVNQYFGLLIGAAFPASPTSTSTVSPTDPDLIGGTLGNLRDELGLSFKNQDFVNSVEDEQDLSNYRIISDYVTSLAQSWLNNIDFLVLDTKTPFFGTRLVLLSRQLSVVAESIDEVRFTLDSVFIGPAERQTIELDSTLVPPFPLPPIFLEDLLSWIQNFATEEGPRLIQDGGKFGVQNTFFPVADKLLKMVSELLKIVTAVPAAGLPPGAYTKRVQKSVGDLNDQLRQLADFARPIEHLITPEPVDLAFEVTGVKPNSISISSVPYPYLVPAYIRGSGFELGSSLPTVAFLNGPATIGVPQKFFRSDELLAVTLDLSSLAGVSPITGKWDVTVTNPDPTSKPFTLQQALTVTN